jgi:hypothetical protein
MAEKQFDDENYSISEDGEWYLEAQVTSNEERVDDWGEDEDYPRAS